MFLDRGVSLPSTTAPVTSAVNKVVRITTRKCKVCNKNVEKAKMRSHIGKHILKGGLKGATICGYWGLSSCIIGLTQGSSKGNTPRYKATSNCDYSHPFNLKSAENVTKTGPCCNRPVVCSIRVCSVVIWCYNIEEHVALYHKHEEATEYITITGKERTMVLNTKI